MFYLYNGPMYEDSMYQKAFADEYGLECGPQDFQEMRRDDLERCMEGLGAFIDAGQDNPCAGNDLLCRIEGHPHSRFCTLEDLDALPEAGKALMPGYGIDYVISDSGDLRFRWTDQGGAYRDMVIRQLTDEANIDIVDHEACIRDWNDPAVCQKIYAAERTHMRPDPYANFGLLRKYGPFHYQRKDLAVRFEPADIYLVPQLYADGHIGITMTEYGAAEYGMLTANIAGLPDGCIAIDTNNNGKDIMSWLEHIGLGADSGLSIRSGYCGYPIIEADKSIAEDARLNTEFHEQCRAADEMVQENEIER